MDLVIIRLLDIPQAYLNRYRYPPQLVLSAPDFSSVIANSGLTERFECLLHAFPMYASDKHPASPRTFSYHFYPMLGLQPSSCGLASILVLTDDPSYACELLDLGTQILRRPSHLSTRRRAVDSMCHPLSTCPPILPASNLCTSFFTARKEPLAPCANIGPAIIGFDCTN